MASTEQGAIPLSSFEFGGQTQPVLFVETVPVLTGVDCDVYTFNKDPNKDLGIIRIQPGRKTPLQKVLKGDKTIEGYVSGKGKLTITTNDGTQTIHMVGETMGTFSANVSIGQLMQWEADPNSSLTAYEVCYPPYEDGRYENIE